MDKTNNPSLRSWITVLPGSDFPIQNLPFGIIRKADGAAHVATRIGDMVADIYLLAKSGLLDSTEIDPETFNNDSLNPFMELGSDARKTLRKVLSEIFEESNLLLRDNEPLRKKILLPCDSVEMLLPVRPGDYTDFYSSIEHATNVGKMFRDPANALLPNWRHLPVGYHGRSSSIVVSGTPVRRPKGQMKADDAVLPEFGPTRQFDFELEVAFIAGKKSALGNSISTEEAEDHIFGMVLFNDLSARDIQKWEYVPLGPFTSKNFGSVISPWVVTMDALEPFRVPGPEQSPEVLPYLKFTGDRNFDIRLEVFLQPEGSVPVRICRSNYRHMYWNPAQQLAQQTVTGCNINVGDIYGSGTISGPAPDSYGSMLELAWKGTRPLQMPDGTTRSFIHDNDTIIMKGHCEKDGLRIGFGEATVKILPATQ